MEAYEYPGQPVDKTVGPTLPRAASTGPLSRECTKTGVDYIFAEMLAFEPTTLADSRGIVYDEAAFQTMRRRGTTVREQ